MPDQFAKEVAPRVVLLARAGKAADNLADALREAGAELVMTADPATTDEATLRAHRPQVVLVALEPSIEHALDRLEAVLHDPALTVIYDEADLAAHRAGWDAARWVRHLSAKIRHDSNVLPPGTESDQDWQPSPGQVPKPAAAYADVDLTVFTREAVASANSVPADGIQAEFPSALHAAVLPDAAPSALSPASVVSDIQFFQIDSFEVRSLETAALEDARLQAALLDDARLEEASLEAMSLEAAPSDTLLLEAMDFEDSALGNMPPAASNVAPMALEDDAYLPESLADHDDAVSVDSRVLSAQLDGGFDMSLDFESDTDAAPASIRVDTPRPFESVLSFEDLIAGGIPSAEAVSVPTQQSPQTQDTSGFSLGDLSLAPVDESPAVGEKPSAVPHLHDLSALEARISGLSLVDLDDSASQPPGMLGAGTDAIGVVLVEAGLGGPDPARQLLSSIPAEFPAIVLVRLHLQGGRYDRLVAQMERASALPVALAHADAVASPGTIYFLPDGIGFDTRHGDLAFTADAGFAGAGSADVIFDALPPGNSAVVFLSGSDLELVDTAMSAAARGTLVIAQSAEDCYDGTACAELRKRGTVSGLPAELAGRLASRWPS